MKSKEEYEKTVISAIADYLNEHIPTLLDQDVKVTEELFDNYFKEEKHATAYRQFVNVALLKEMNENFDADVLKMGREHPTAEPQTVCNLVIAKVRDYDVMWESCVVTHPDILLPHLFKERVKECFVSGNLKALSNAAKYL